MKKEEIISLPNGRVYKIVDTGEEYKQTDYQYNASNRFVGGFVIYCQLKSGSWAYIDNSPDRECADNFIKMASRLGPAAI